MEQGSQIDDCLSGSAMRLLSSCYRYGIGTSINQEKADYWMQEAAKNNDNDAIELINITK